MTAWKKQTDAQKAASRERVRKWKIENRERYLANRKQYNRFREYGLAHGDFMSMLEEQNYLCAACDTPLFDDKNTHVDHNHSTGKIRGLLCQACNLALGMVKENVETLLKLGVYLEKHRG